MPSIDATSLPVDPGFDFETYLRVRKNLTAYFKGVAECMRATPEGPTD